MEITMVQDLRNLPIFREPGFSGWWWFEGTLTPVVGVPREISCPAWVGTGRLSQTHGVVIGGTMRFKDSLEGTWRFLGSGR